MERRLADMVTRFTRSTPKVCQELVEGFAAGPAEAIDSLVGVADREDVGSVSAQQTRQLDLGDVGVLELVNQDEARSLLRPQEDRLAAAEQVYGAGDDVAESAEAVLLQHFLELPIDAGDLAAAAEHILVADR